MLTENVQRLEAAGTRFREAEAHALREEAMTMEEIGRLSGPTRQRISALIRNASTRTGRRPERRVSARDAPRPHADHHLPLPSDPSSDTRHKGDP